MPEYNIPPPHFEMEYEQEYDNDELEDEWDEVMKRFRELQRQRQAEAQERQVEQQQFNGGIIDYLYKNGKLQTKSKFDKVKGKLDI